ncbi:MAG: autotransporter domain-containing protein [Planctomycetaceae bacterium]|nr:autotransporter domain-containing protein [Planctomycetaceae bacterium]
MKPKFRKHFCLLHRVIAISATVIFPILLTVLLVNVLGGGVELFAADPVSLHNSPAPTKPPEYSGYVLYGIDDDKELSTVLSDASILNKWIKLEDNVFIPSTMQFNLMDYGDLVIDLGMFNLQTDSNFEFLSSQHSTVTVIGSTMLANGGLQFLGNTTLNYYGTYSSGRADILASHSGDETIFNMTGVNSRWDATNTTPKFINDLYGHSGYENGTIIIGEYGKVTVNITSGNDVDSGEVIIGAKRNADDAVLNLAGIYELEDIYNPNQIIKKATTWNNTGTLYIGYGGKGTVNISHGAVMKTGSIGLSTGIDYGQAGKGTLNITGTGNFVDKTITENYIINNPNQNILNPRDNDYIIESNFLDKDTTHIYIYGRDDEVKQANDKHVGFLSPSSNNDGLTSYGDGVMTIANGAIVEFDETKTLSGEPSNYTPKIVLGIGDSVVDNSMILGARDAAEGDMDIYGNVDTDRYDDVGLIDGGRDASGTFRANTLTFQNNSVLQGNLKIRMGENIFKSGSILTPGAGSYHLYLPSDDLVDQENFGRVEFTNNKFTHDSTATTIIDFNIHGDQNYRSDPSKQTAYSDNGDNFGYADNEPYQGRDLITIDGDASLAGDIYFRPQTGYYSDNVKVDFMRVTGSIDGQYEGFHLYPYRWFKDPQLVKENQMNMFVADRNLTPFTDVSDSHNTRGVGGALDRIYNTQDNDEWLPILDWFWLMNDEELRDAEQLLAGEVRASSFYMPMRSAWRFGFDRVNWSDVGHKVYFGAQDSLCPQIKKNTLWATSYFDYQSIDDDHNSSSMSTQRVSSMVGYDRALPAVCDIGFLSDSAAGVLFSYSQPKLDQQGCRVVMDDYLVGFHSATRLFSTYEVKSWLGVGAQRYRLKRHIPIEEQNPNLTTNYKGNSASGSIQVARPMKWYGLMLRPHVAFDINFVKQYSGLDEYDGDVMKQVALRYHSSDWTQFFGRTGLRLDYGKTCCGHRYNLSATLGYSYLLLGDQAPKSTHEFAYAGGGKFKILGSNPGRSFVNVDLGTQLYLNQDKNKMIFLQYNSNYGKYMNAHTAAIGYQFMF